MTREEFIKEYRRNGGLKGIMVEYVIDHYGSPKDDICANNLICALYHHPEYYNFFEENEEEIRKTARKVGTRFTRDNYLNLSDLVATIKAKEILQDYNERVDNMTKKQKQELERYFEGFNEVQNTLHFAFESDGKTILAQGYTNAGGDYPFEFDVADEIEGRRVVSLQEDGVAEYLKALANDICENFDVDEELDTWGNVESSRRNGLSLSQLCHDLEDFEKELDEARNKIVDYINDKSRKGGEEENENENGWQR